MGTSGNIICCKIPDALVKSMKVPIDSENNEETSDIDIDNLEKDDIKINEDKCSIF